LKNKTKTYLLFTGVLFIWGILSYKIIIGINPDVPEISEQNLNIEFNPKAHKSIDSFSIQNTTRDPFLGTLAYNKKITKKVSPNSTENQQEILYKGLVKRQNTSDQVFVISIENSQYLLKSGQTINNIKLVSGNAKSIKVFYNNTYQIINRQ